MAASNREIANTYISFNNLDMPNLVEINTISKDVNIDKLRDRFLLSSPNVLKETLTYSNILSIPYINRIEAQSNDLS